MWQFQELFTLNNDWLKSGNHTKMMLRKIETNPRSDSTAILNFTGGNHLGTLLPPSCKRKSQKSACCEALSSLILANPLSRD